MRKQDGGGGGGGGGGTTRRQRRKVEVMGKTFRLPRMRWFLDDELEEEEAEQEVRRDHLDSCLSYQYLLGVVDNDDKFNYGKKFDSWHVCNFALPELFLVKLFGYEVFDLEQLLS